jgi:hypothetical protein
MQPMTTFAPRDVQFLVEAVEQSRLFLARRQSDPPDGAAVAFDADEVHRQLRRLLTRIAGEDDFTALTALLANTGWT